jgi:hypothetical protein
MQYISVCRRQPVPRLPHLFPYSGISTADGSPFDGIYLRIGATNCDAETRGELRATTPCLLVVAPQVSAVVNIEITSRFGRPLVLRQ